MTIFPLRRSGSDQLIKTEIINFLRCRGLTAWRVNLDGLHVQAFMPGMDGRVIGIEVRRPGDKPSMKEDPKREDWATIFGRAGAVHIVASSVHDVRLRLDKELRQPEPAPRVPYRSFQPERVAVAPS